jgi:type II secretory pathway component PulK
LEHVGAANAARLAGALGDFVDEDDLTRPAGAEKDAYRRARLSPPPNQALTTRWRTLEAIGWRAALGREQARALWANTSVTPQGRGLNVNTAPLAVLVAVLGDARTARSVLTRREQDELRAQEDIEALTGINTRAGGVGLATQAGTVFRIVVRTGVSRHGYESQLQLAEPGAARPIYWREARALSDGLDIEAADVLPEPSLAP